MRLRDLAFSTAIPIAQRVQRASLVLRSCTSIRLLPEDETTKRDLEIPGGRKFLLVPALEKRDMKYRGMPCTQALTVGLLMLRTRPIIRRKGLEEMMLSNTAGLGLLSGSFLNVPFRIGIHSAGMCSGLNKVGIANPY